MRQTQTTWSMLQLSKLKVKSISFVLHVYIMELLLSYLFYLTNSISCPLHIHDVTVAPVYQLRNNKLIRKFSDNPCSEVSFSAWHHQIDELQGWFCLFGFTILRENFVVKNFGSKSFAYLWQPVAKKKMLNESSTC